MQFKQHKDLTGLHAPFSASKSSWLRYDEAKMLEVYENRKAAAMGTVLHEWAKQTIDLGIKQPKSKKTLYQYVNDAIGFKMSTEVVLYYSDRFFGTTDAIAFRNNMLRIHDLKTGKTPAHIEQLVIYAALFCLEYHVNPKDIDIELRIYQDDEILYHNPTAEEVVRVMEKIISSDKLLMEAERKEAV